MTSDTTHQREPVAPQRRNGDGPAAAAIVLLTIALIALVVSKIVSRPQ